MDLIVDNGKPVEPSTIKKVVAAISRDTDAVIVLPWLEVRRIVGHELFNGAIWLRKYKSFDAKYNQSDGSVTFTFHTDPKTE